MFKPDFFNHNRAELKKKLSPASLFIFTANGLLQRTGSTTYPFRQDSNFWYLTGIDQQDVVLVIDGSHEYLILPSRDPVYETFNGKIDSSSLQKVSGIKTICAKDEGWERLARAIKRNRSLVTCLPAEAYLDREGFYTNPARQQLVNSLKEINGEIELVDARPALAELRAIKRPEEIKTISRAIDLTTANFSEIKEKFNSLTTEKEIELDLTCGFLKGGASGHAYDPIVASDKHACTLHYISNSGDLKKGQLVLIDAGAELNHYASDITRTYCYGEPSKRQIEVQKAVMGIRSFALSCIKPGVSLKQYELAIEDHAGEVLQELGLIKSKDREAIHKFYPHSTSHSLGLDVHDPIAYDKPLQPNTILTVEPGIYIPREKIGIRIEDDVLVTDSGYKILSAKLDRSL